MKTILVDMLLQCVVIGGLKKILIGYQGKQIGTLDTYQANTCGGVSEL